MRKKTAFHEEGNKKYFYSPPPYLASRFKYRSDVWPRVAQTVYLMATTGISLRQELAEKLAKQWGITPVTGSLKHLLKKVLPDLDLIVQEEFRLVGPSTVLAWRLSAIGERLSRVLGATPVQSEWERLIKLHAGNDQPRHTAAVLYFAYQARRRGWQVQILPQISHGSEPDVLLTRSDQRLYVEVERGHSKKDKWLAQEDLQGFAAFCALTQSRRYGLVRECQSAGVPGMATDIQSLGQLKDQKNLFWMETW